MAASALARCISSEYLSLHSCRLPSHFVGTKKLKWEIGRCGNSGLWRMQPGPGGGGTVALVSLCAASGLQSRIKKALGLLWKPAISPPPTPTASV